MLQDMKIGVRLWSGFGLVLLMLALIAGIGIKGLIKVDDGFEIVLHEQYQKVVLATAMDDALAVISSESRNILLVKNPEKAKSDVDAILTARRIILDKIDALAPLVKTEQGKRLLSTIEDGQKKYFAAHDRFLDMVKNGRWDDGIQILFHEVFASQAICEANVKELIAYQEKLMKGASTDARETLNRDVMLLLIIAGMALMLSTAFVLWIGGSITRSLENAAKCIARISHGDVPDPIHEPWAGEFDKIRESLNTASTAIRTLIQEIRVLGQAGVEGRLAVRANTAKHQGDYRNILEMFNATLDTITHPVEDVVHVMTALENGDLSQQVSTQYKGMMGQLCSSVNNTIGQIRTVIEDIQFIALSAGQGDFSVRLEAGDKKGYHQTLSELLNQLTHVTEDGLLDVIRVASALAHGDLTETIDKNYPGLFGQVQSGLNATIEKLRALVNAIKEATDSIHTASGELSTGNTDLSERTSEQASALEETAASVEQLTSTVQQNAENARNANQLSIHSSSVAEQGGAVVNEVIHTMDSIQHSARKIVDIISVIDGIAFQTNILALNAAVEAARAGEQGRGFAVVATEVRSLAQRSATAAKEIQVLIKESVSNVDAGTRLVGEAGKTMTGIITSINRVTGIMQEISAAATEQSKGIEQVNQAIVQIEDVTHRNAALVEEAAAATESLKDQANALATSVGTFKLQSGARNSTKTAALLSAPTKTETSHFDDAIAAHIKWKIRLNQFIDGTSTEKLESDTVCKDNLCILGKWIYGDGKKYHEIHHYTDLVAKHANFHRCAGSVVQKVESRDKLGALSILKGDFSVAAKETVTTLMNLKRYLQNRDHA